MKNNTEKNGIHKIVSYPQEVYCVHYKGKPFSLSYVSCEGQRALGIPYLALEQFQENVILRRVTPKMGSNTCRNF